MPSKTAQRLGELRRRTGLNQDDLSTRLGCPQSTYGNWESGRNDPPVEWIARLAKFHGVTADFLVGLVDHEGPLPVDAWVVDEDFVDAVRSGAWNLEQHGDTGSFPVPRRMKIVSSVEHHKLERELRKRIEKLERDQ